MGTRYWQWVDSFTRLFGSLTLSCRGGALTSRPAWFTRSTSGVGRRARGASSPRCHARLPDVADPLDVDASGSVNSTDVYLVDSEIKVNGERILTNLRTR